MTLARGTVGLVLALSTSGACTGDHSVTQASVPWTTEREYLFGDAPERDVFFSRPLVRADPARNRVFVIDRASSQVTAWSEGSLSFILGGRGQGPGEFIAPAFIYFGAGDTISVVEVNGSRYSYFTADGERIRTAPGPVTSVSYQGFRVALTPPRDGIHVGVPRIPSSIEVGADGVPPLHRQPLLRVRRAESGQWLDPELLLWLDFDNGTLAAHFPDGSTAYGTQPFGDADQYQLRPGAAVVMRQRGVPGTVELVEVTGLGDTAWHRQLQFEPRTVTRMMYEAELDRIVDMFSEAAGSRISRQEFHEAYSEAIYRPEFLPTARGFILTASGEVWMRTHEVSDTLRTYYVVPRGESSAAPRRVLIPEALQITDATATHVWGVGLDSMDVPYIFGRRLIAPTEGN